MLVGSVAGNQIPFVRCHVYLCGRWTVARGRERGMGAEVVMLAIVVVVIFILFFLRVSNGTSTSMSVRWDGFEVYKDRWCRA